MIMQLLETGDSHHSGGTVIPDLSVLWPSNSSDDIIRQTLTAILLEDPDHRLRVAHLEPLLHLRVGSEVACSSGRLQALLTDPSTLRIFAVDFANTRATEWRSRVVYLDAPQLLKEVAAAKQQQQLSSATSAEQNSTLANGNSTPGAGHDATSAVMPSRNHHMMHARPTGNSFNSAHDGLGMSSSLGQQPRMLETIFGNSSGLGALAGEHAGSISSTGGIAPRRISGSMSATAGNGFAGSHGTAGSFGAGEPRVSLFGSSFEVPHAIASCWAGPSSCSSGVGSVGTTGAAAAPGKGPAGREQPDGCGGSSTASASSTRSVNATNRAAANAASRLRKATGSTAEGGADAVDGPGHQLSTVGSSGGLSGLDVCTPKYGVAGTGDTSASPVHSSAGEDDVEYNEAQLVFGVPGTAAATNNGAAPAAPAAAASAANVAGNAVEGETAVAEQLLSPSGGAVAAAAGSNSDTPIHGVDWARVAALQQQEQQGMAGHFGRMHHSMLPGNQALLFGLEDFSYDIPGGAPAGMQGNSHFAQQQQHAAAVAAAAQQHAYASTLAAANNAMAARRLVMDQSSGFGGLNLLDPAPPALFSPPQHRISAGSAPAVPGLQDLAFLHEHASLLAGNAGAAAAAAGGATGFGFNPAAATAAQLAESVLLEGDSRGVLGSQQLQFGVHSSSYSNSSVGGWGTSPGSTGQFGQLQQQQQQLHRPSDAHVDIGFGSDQVKDNADGAARAASGGAGGGSTAAAAALTGKPVGLAGGSPVARAPAGPEAAPAAAAAGSTNSAREKAIAAATPRLTGWASIAAKEPKVSPGTPMSAAAAAANSSSSSSSNAQCGSAGPSAAGAWAGGRPHGAAGGGAIAAANKAAAGGGGDAGRPISRLPQRVRNEVHALIAQFNGVLKVDDFDDGVVHQLNTKRSEEEAIAAVRHVAHYDLVNIQHMAAYLNHLVKHYNHNAAAAAAAAAENIAHGTAGLAAGNTAGAGGLIARNGASSAGAVGMGAVVTGAQLLAGQGGGLGSTLGGSRSGSGSVTGSVAAAAAGGNLGAFGGQIRLASVPVSTKSMLQKLPLKVFKQLEQLVASCAYLEWRHFDAGVVKVLAQLSKLCEADVFEELELLAATDLSNVEYMPAYLNKRLNNKLWSRRKAEGHVPSG